MTRQKTPLSILSNYHRQQKIRKLVLSYFLVNNLLMLGNYYFFNINLAKNLKDIILCLNILSSVLVITKAKSVLVHLKKIQWKKIGKNSILNFMFIIQIFGPFASLAESYSRATSSANPYQQTVVSDYRLAMIFNRSLGDWFLVKIKDKYFDTAKPESRENLVNTLTGGVLVWRGARRLTSREIQAHESVFGLVEVSFGGYMVWRGNFEKKLPQSIVMKAATTLIWLDGEFDYQNNQLLNKKLDQSSSESSYLQEVLTVQSSEGKKQQKACLRELTQKTKQFNDCKCTLNLADMVVNEYNKLAYQQKGLGILYADSLINLDDEVVELKTLIGELKTVIMVKPLSELIKISDKPVSGHLAIERHIERQLLNQKLKEGYDLINDQGAKIADLDKKFEDQYKQYKK